LSLQPIGAFNAVRWWTTSFSAIGWQARVGLRALRLRKSHNQHDFSHQGVAIRRLNPEMG